MLFETDEEKNVNVVFFINPVLMGLMIVFVIISYNLESILSLIFDY